MNTIELYKTVSLFLNDEETNMVKTKKKITINHVAEQANVSKTTVSRYLNGKYEILSEETRKRIEEVIDSLGYRPSRVAQGLKSHSSGVIGCLVSDIGSPFSSILVKGISSECLKEGYQLILVDSEDNAENERRAIDNLMEQQVDGLIINSTGENDDYILQLASERVPIVLADRPLSIPGTIDTVLTDNAESLYKCMQYLKKVGYTKVAFFSSVLKKNEVRRLRYRAFCEADRALFGADSEPSTYFYDDLEDCVHKIRDFVTNYANERIAILAVNGVALLDVLNTVLKNTGIRIGSELGICGFDNWGWADLIGPGITTITQDTWNVGAESAKLLFRRIKGDGEEKTVTKVLNNILEVRGSTVSL